MAPPSALVHTNKALERVIVVATKGDASSSYYRVWRALTSGGFDVGAARSFKEQDIKVRPDFVSLARTKQLVLEQLNAHGIAVHSG